jgi:hypothetical protein
MPIRRALDMCPAAYPTRVTPVWRLSAAKDGKTGAHAVASP